MRSHETKVLRPKSHPPKGVERHFPSLRPRLSKKECSNLTDTFEGGLPEPVVAQVGVLRDCYADL